MSAAVKALRQGHDAVLDRDWSYYDESEHAEAQWYARDNFMQVAADLERLLD